MTQLMKFRDSISNYFDRIEAGLGARGSSFMDIDAISHDGATNRFLVREFKERDEPLSRAQASTLYALATLPGVTVWIVRRLDHGLIALNRCGHVETITEGEYRSHVAAWWQGVDWRNAHV